MHQNYTLGLVKHINAQIHTFTTFSLREKCPDLKQNEAHERPCRTDKQRFTHERRHTNTFQFNVALGPKRQQGRLGTGEPRTATSTFQHSS